MTVGVSVGVVRIGSMVADAVKVGKSVGAVVAEGVRGAGVGVGGNVAVITTNGGVNVGRTMGRTVGRRPIQAAKMPPMAPMIAAITRVFCPESFLVI